MSVVLDASVALAWIFERADLEEIEQANTVLAELNNRPAVVPVLWDSGERVDYSPAARSC